MYQKKYLDTWVIALCFSFWFLVIPAIFGIVFLIMQYMENRKLIQMYGNYTQLNNKIQDNYTTLTELSTTIDNLKNNKQQLQTDTNNYESNKSQLQIDINNLQNTKNQLQVDIDDLQHVYNDLELNAIVDSFDYASYDSYSSEECKNKLATLKQEEKQLAKDNKTVTIISTGTKREINNNIKQIIRCFNAECDNIVLSVTLKNIESLRNKITKSFDSINKIFETNGVQLDIKLLEYKLKELTLLYEYEKKYQQEKEIQKAIKEQMIEEEKARKELEKREAEIEKDEKQFNKEISKMMKYLQKSSNDVEIQIYADKIKELEEKLKALETEKEDVVNRRQNAKAGFVYIISNIGSFGEDIYKIGMTRRLEPMDRIKELSSASVPFEFDVHAMIFSEDAPALETSLHSHFDKYRVNKVNPRKEFFKINIAEIEDFVDETFDKTVQFTKVPVAKEYHESLCVNY